MGAKGYSYPKPTGQKTLCAPMVFRLLSPKSSQKGYNYAIVWIIHHAIYITFSSLLQVFFYNSVNFFIPLRTAHGNGFLYTILP